MGRSPFHKCWSSWLILETLHLTNNTQISLIWEPHQRFSRIPCQLSASQRCCSNPSSYSRLRSIYNEDNMTELRQHSLGPHHHRSLRLAVSLIISAGIGWTEAFHPASAAFCFSLFLPPTTLNTLIFDVKDVGKPQEKLRMTIPRFTWVISRSYKYKKIHDWESETWRLTVLSWVSSSSRMVTFLLLLLSWHNIFKVSTR